MSSSYPELYLEGLRLFNEAEFFECHDVLEELWGESLGDEREFYQGLIQAAVALFHFENGNLGGAKRMYDSACRYLQPYGAEYMGIDLQRFLDDLKVCFQELSEARGQYPAHVVLKSDRVPKIAASNQSS
jgi:uncharacterized protein